MRKMRTPEIDVIRFTESDIVAASGGKFITIAGLGDCYTEAKIATFTMGANTWNSITIVNAGEAKCKDMMDAYAGGKTTGGYIYVGNEQKQVFDLAGVDYWLEDSEEYSVYNGTYEWNGNKFLKKQ